MSYVSSAIKLIDLLILYYFADIIFYGLDMCFVRLSTKWGVNQKFFSDCLWAIIHLHFTSQIRLKIIECKRFFSNSTA